MEFCRLDTNEIIISTRAELSEGSEWSNGRCARSLKLRSFAVRDRLVMSGYVRLFFSFIHEISNRLLDIYFYCYYENYLTVSKNYQ